MPRRSASPGLCSDGALRRAGRAGAAMGRAARQPRRGRHRSRRHPADPCVVLSDHTGALVADPRCSLLLRRTRQGRPAGPSARQPCAAWPSGLAPGTTPVRAERRYLNRHPKARLYAGFGDFAFFRLAPERARLNGGFGKAYHFRRANSFRSWPPSRARRRRAAGARPHECRPRRRGRRLCARLRQAAGGGWS